MVYMYRKLNIISLLKHTLIAQSRKKWLSFCQSELKNIKVNYIKENVIESDNALLLMIKK